MATIALHLVPVERPPLVTTAGSWTRRIASSVAGAMLWSQAVLVAATLVLAVVYQSMPIVIRGASMTPTISIGDVIMVDHPSANEDLLGAVVVFSREGTFVSHRIVKMDDNGLFVTKGDANMTADSPPVARADIEGRGRVVVPYVGLPSRWIRTSPLSLLMWLIVNIICWRISRLEQVGELNDPEHDNNNDTQIDELEAA